MAQALAAAELATYDEVKGQLKSKVGMTDGLPLTLCTAFASGYVSTVRDGYAAVTTFTHVSMVGLLHWRVHKRHVSTASGRTFPRFSGCSLWLLSGCSLWLLSGCS